MKLRFTALSISSMDMNTVMMLRRNRKPATPSANRIALSVRYQESGIRRSVKRKRRHLVDLLSRQHDRAEDGDQDQDAGDFKRQQVGGEQPLADLLRRCRR